MSPFEPLGEKARWRIVYALLRDGGIGDTVTYKAIGAALELHPDEDRHVIQMAVRRAAKEHEQIDHRAVEAISNVGYRIVEPAEHMRLAGKHQQRGGREIAKAQSKVVNVNMSGLDPSVRRGFEVVGAALTALADMHRRMDIRATRLEQTVAEITQGTSRTEDEMSALRERMEAMQARIDGMENGK